MTADGSNKTQQHVHTSTVSGAGGNFTQDTESITPAKPAIDVTEDDANDDADDLAELEEALAPKVGEYMTQLLTQVSLAGGKNAKDELLNKISKLEDAKSALQKEINLLNKRITEEKENCENLVEGLKKTETIQGQLGREMRECKNRLSMIKNATADKEAQIKQMK